MTIKLIQKQFLNGRREFEIIDDAIFVKIKSLLKEEKLTISLSMLDPEPVINGAVLEFNAQGKPGALLSLFINKPDEQAFNTFVALLRQRIQEVNNDFSVAMTELPESPRDEMLQRNVYEVPSEFEETDQEQQIETYPQINTDRVAEDITMLKTYLAAEDIKALLIALETLMAAPESEEAFDQLLETYHGLGFQQGAVLTYAPYLKILVSNALTSADLFGDHNN